MRPRSTSTDTVPGVSVIAFASVAFTGGELHEPLFFHLSDGLADRGVRHACMIRDIPNRSRLYREKSAHYGRIARSVVDVQIVVRTLHISIQ